ncbi:MAG: polysaccharide biosynthesis tyrosine autokinase [Nitrospiraceae bacterium]|nr:polysaccharide biosynthesis tyrosine autokinase [Nitrospiraceae bacterium]
MENDGTYPVRDMRAGREGPPPCRIGEILVKAGKISTADLSNVADMQKTEDILFGEAAVKMGLITGEDLAWALDVQFSCRPLASPGQGAVSAEIIAAHRPSDALTEVFRSIRGSLIHSGVGGRIKTVSIISPDRGEGKTFIAANLAASFAQIGCATLLADLNFRTPRIHELFGIKNNCGISSLLIRRAELDEAVRESSIPSLRVLPSGPAPPNPGELMGSGDTRQLISALKDTFDVVIVDTPPFLTASDAVATAPHTDGMLLVASRGRTTMATLGAVKRGLENSGGRIMGVLINEPPPKQGDARMMKSLIKAWGETIGGMRPWVRARRMRVKPWVPR